MIFTAWQMHGNTVWQHEMRVTGGNPIRVWSKKLLQLIHIMQNWLWGSAGVLLIVRLLDHVRIVLIILICDSLV